MSGIHSEQSRESYNVFPTNWMGLKIGLEWELGISCFSTFPIALSHHDCALEFHS